MSQHYIVPNIYQDMSDQSQGYFAFRFVCQHCYWQIDTRPQRSTVSTASNIIDIGSGFLNGFWGKAAEAGQKIYGSQWHSEQANALQKAWGEIQHNFHTCPQCHQTVCMRCFNIQLNLCTTCAPDLRADGAHFQHNLNIEAQRAQLQNNYQAPQFNLAAIPSAVTPEIAASQSHPSSPQLPPPQNAAASSAIAGYGVQNYPTTGHCPHCRKEGTPGKFCEDCGTKIPLPDLFCPSCSLPVAITARFCAECGAKLQSAT
ncbi:zinc ribbon domain-containing protein [Tengunoibacter tsumagoiensis]|uniref:DZANK-type domain-containing protein n=1 Tax=Tengunoibacter tsumagoiensis TaxID=2014871 RepID=A0A402A5B7_9CHLR|nr:zinc ribbon domain-containing protein [Tengunoibacter tsumagoiensis]GCE14302.1 hypothetical protein KTT_41610 [Tengunoibacter tsumagoiensis]